MVRSRPGKARRTAAVPAPRRGFAPSGLAWLAIAGLGSLVYANSLNGPFLFDDYRAIVENLSIRQLWPLTPVLETPLQSPMTGRPLANLSLALNYAFGGVAVRGYHVLNVIVHTLAGLALFLFLRLTFARGAQSPDVASRAVVLAVVGAVAWVVHPLNSEAVNYVTQRNELLMGLFSFLTLISSIRALEARRPLRWELTAGGWALCAVASKEAALVLPLLVLLWDRVFHYGTFGAAWRERRRLYALVGASWLLFAYYARTLPFFGPQRFEHEVSRWTYLSNQAAIIVDYLRLSVWPSGLIFDYGLALPLTFADVWLQALFIAGLMAATAWALVRQPCLGFWGAWFFITLAPASSVIPLPTEVGAERRMYLPLVAVLAIGLHLAVLVFRRAGSRWRQLVALGLSLATLGALSLATIRRNDDYRTTLAIWQTVVDRRPHARAHDYLSIALRDAGRLDEALAQLRIAAPELPSSRLGLASALLERGEVAESIMHYRVFIDRYPNDRNIAIAREELAIALIQAGDADGALEQYRAVTRAMPDYARGHVGLAQALLARSDPDGAIREFREALRVQPDNVVALAALGSLLAERGAPAEALPLLRRAFALEPRALPPRRVAIGLLLAAGNLVDAEKEARALVSLVPDDANAHNLLGVALAGQQRAAMAHDHFTEALRLDPAHQEARANLTRLRN